MKNSFLSAVLFLLFISAQFFSQVVIKERITVTPSDSLLSKGSADKITAYTWDDYGTSVEEITVSAGSQVAIEFLSRTASHISDLYFNGQLIVPAAVSYFYYEQCFENEQQLSFNLYIHAEGGHWATDMILVQKYGSDTEYRVFFEDYTDFDYNDLVIGVTINPIPEILHVAQEHQSLYHQDRSKIYLNISSSCYQLPENYSYILTILEGGEFGYLQDITTGIAGDNLVLDNNGEHSRNIEFVAAENVNVETQLIKIGVATSIQGVNNEVVDLILIPSPLVIQPVPNVIGPGDTSDIVILFEEPGIGLIPFPPDQLFYISIQQGSEYGTLYSSALNSTADNFTEGLPGSFSFIAEETIPYNSVDVTISVMTMIEEDEGGSSLTEGKGRNLITTTKMLSGLGYLEITKGDMSLYTAADPPVIAPGKESHLVIKAEAPDGTLSDFPPDQLFYIFLDWGWEYGTLYSTEMGDTSEFFEDIPGNFSFFANDSINVDTAFVSIYVSTFTDGPPIGAVEGLKTRHKKLSRYFSGIKKKGRNMTTDYEPIPGLLEDFIDIMIVKSEDCSDAPQCESNELIIPKLMINPNYSNGIYGIDACQEAIEKGKDPIGVFRPILDNFSNTFENLQSEVCYDASNDRWNAAYEDNEIRIRAIVDLCTEVIGSGELLYDTNEIDSIDPTELCDALYSFRKHKYLDYKKSSAFKNFYIAEVAFQHEFEHVDDFQDYTLSAAMKQKIEIDGNQYSGFVEAFSSFSLSCDDISGYEEAKFEIDSYNNNLLDRLREKIILQYNNDKIALDANDRQGHKLLHGRNEIQELIKKYIRKIEKRIKKLDKKC